MMQEFFHSVTLDTSKCKGCINCIKRCPTEAIRVHDGKASIIAERCIDCGECIRICPHHAKMPIYDSLDVLDNFEYTIALPAPALYGQFNNLEDVDPVLNALLDIGFDDVFEVATAAELISDATRHLMESGKMQLPVISSACPAVTRLIRVRFPGLVENVLPLVAPAELAARMAKRRAMEKTGLPEEKIGAIFISPCPAKVTAMKMPIGTQHCNIDAVVAIKEIYPKLLHVMKHDNDRPLQEAGRIGIGWAQSGGEASGLISTDSYLAADGVENVIKVLEDLEDEKLGTVDFVELNICSGGCVGGVLTVENPYIAQAKIKKLRRYQPVSKNHLNGSIPTEMLWDADLEYTPVMELGTTRQERFDRYTQLEEIEAALPGLDCGSCGAPNCLSFAEDVVRGEAKVEDCVVLMRQKMEELLKDYHKEK
ncbi:MAG: [Fe-Fe] hydrogenase large subunit C-terminal domain-containing protein [Oscillospiraceae bacterium]